MKNNPWIFLFTVILLVEDSRSQTAGIQIKGPPRSNIGCGSKYPIGIYYGTIGDRFYPVYYFNNTAEKLAAKGFKIEVLDMHSDAIKQFVASNKTYSQMFAYDGVGGVAGVGGENAETHRSFYMAQLGLQKGSKIDWLCDGVVVNREWVLSAAHCFLNPNAEPNLVRLGDYNTSTPSEPFDGHFTGKFVYDFVIADVIVHPEFDINERYHDVVLIRLSRKYPDMSSSINPVCLPWDSLTNENLIGKIVTLTGWGATRYGGNKTDILQQLDLEVFPTTVCHENYKRTPSFGRRYPSGLTSDKILCAGWKEGGKDACGGDSGAPIVFLHKNRYVLAGIVSAGFGCGRKEFPGLYVPINKPTYLQWIKDVAFRGIA